MNFHARSWTFGWKILFLLLVETKLSVLSFSIPTSRRAVLAAAGVTFTVAVAPSMILAAPDCFSDCLKNCKLIAPKDPDYCNENCVSYCEQSDRTDGLSGSVSSATGETGILGLTTVVKGDDKPPQINLPGLDFTSGQGKTLIGY
jgi:hypothetical protein